MSDPSVTVLTSSSIEEVTLEKGLMDVVNVGSLLARALTSLITGKFTLEKDLRG